MRGKGGQWKGRVPGGSGVDNDRAARPPVRQGHRDENFPVASVLISARHRGPILAFYEFVRTADDIADHPTLRAREKLAQLDALEADLLGQRRRRAGDGAARGAGGARLAPRHAQDLLDAFRMDVTKLRYRDWDELIGLLQPFGDAGRPLRARRPWRDALDLAGVTTRCVRHCRSSITRRIVAPTTATSTASMCRSMRCAPPAPASRTSARRDPRRSCCAACMDSRTAPPLCWERARALRHRFDDFRPVPGSRGDHGDGAAHRRPRRQSRSASARTCISTKLGVIGGACRGGGRNARPPAAQRRRRRPLERRMSMARGERRSPNAGRASGSSFYAAMRILPSRSARRCMRSMAFAAQVDDIADSPALRDQRLAQLAAVAAATSRRSIRGSPTAADRRPRAAGARTSGCERTTSSPSSTAWKWTCAPTSARPILDELDLYCDRVASAVGRLSVRIFGLDVERRAAISPIISAARCSSPTSCAISTRTPPSAGSICRGRPCIRPASKPSEPAVAVASPALGPGLRRRRARRASISTRPTPSWRLPAPRGARAAHHGRGLSAHARAAWSNGAWPRRAPPITLRQARARRGSSCATPSSDGAHRPHHRRRTCGTGRRRRGSPRAAWRPSSTRRPTRPAAAAAPITTPPLDMRIDNGTHILLSGNSAALASLADDRRQRTRRRHAAERRIPFVDLATNERWTLELGDGRLSPWVFDPERRAPGTRRHRLSAAVAPAVAGARQDDRRDHEVQRPAL